MPPPYKLRFSCEAAETYERLKKRDPRKRKKVKKALEWLATEGPDYPGLHTHKMRGIKEKVYISYVENQTPAAWRITWSWWGDVIGIISIHPHP